MFLVCTIGWNDFWRTILFCIGCIFMSHLMNYHAKVHENKKKYFRKYINPLPLKPQPRIVFYRWSSFFSHEFHIETGFGLVFQSSTELPHYLMWRIWVGNQLSFIIKAVLEEDKPYQQASRVKYDVLHKIKCSRLI